ncbi:zinc finger domain-containing protein [Streptomyces chryseus]|uniref:zinc finger domain-containing protein n=1 Tax=Streptomyces chryseus TaxID=68186 RepID=UPI00142EF71F|nr:hypothetical protein [Streptomyces chryseus]
MDSGDAAELLGYCAAFDNRTVGEVDARGWAAALYDIPLDNDARAAVARYYGTPPERPGERLWIQPHHVKSGWYAIRKERLGETLPAYVPPADGLETGAEFIARRRAQIDAVATGHMPARPVGALTGGPARNVIEELAARGFAGAGSPRGLAPVGQRVTGDDAEPAVALDQVRRPGPLGVACPSCKAAIGHRCRTSRGREMNVAHPARRRVAEGGPARFESPEEIEQRRARLLAHFERTSGEAS